MKLCQKKLDRAFEIYYNNPYIKSKKLSEIVGINISTLTSEFTKAGIKFKISEGRY